MSPDNQLLELSNISSISKNDDSKIKIKDLIDSINNNIKDNLISQFGIAQFLDNLKDGGNVDTIHNVRNGIYSNKNVKKNIQSKASGYNATEAQKLHGSGSSAYREINREQTTLKKEHKLYDVNTNKLINQNHKTDLDHTISTKEVYEDQGRILSGKSADEMANNKNNLHLTDRSINRSMEDQRKSDYAKKLIIRKKKWEKQNIIDQNNPHLSEKQKRVKAENYKNKMAANEDAIRQNDENARKAYNHEINKYYMSKKFIGSLSMNSFKQGANQALQSAVGIIIYKIQDAVSSTTIMLIQNWDEYNSLAERFKKFFSTVRDKLMNIKQYISQMKDAVISGFAGGFVSSACNTIINTFKTTSKNIAKIIKDSLVGLISSCKILFSNDTSTTFGQKVKMAIKQVTKAALSSTGLMLGTYIGDFIVTNVPAFAYIKDIVGNAISSILVGALTGLLMFTIDNFGKIFGKFKKSFDNLMLENKLNPDKIENNYQKSLQHIDKIYQSILADIYQKYAKIHNLQQLSYDMGAPVKEQFSASVSLANAVGVDKNKIVKNTNDIDNFFTK